MKIEMRYRQFYLSIPIRTARIGIHLLTVLAVSMILSAAAYAGSEGGAKTPPNVIFIIADDMRPEMFNVLPEGKRKNLSPTIDRLAREGVIMRRQFVASPVCTPSRYNCLTGRYASRAQNQRFVDSTERMGQTVVDWNTFITPRDVTLPKLLKDAGYMTGFAGKNHVFEVHGLKELEWGADARDPKVVSRLKANADHIEQAIREGGFDYAENVYHNNPDHLGVRELAVHNLDWIAKAGLDFIDENHDRPFFLYFATTVPHGPGEAERSWNANPLMTAEGYLDEPLDVLPARETIPQRLKKAGLNAGNSKANVLWLDDTVHALMAKLKEYGIEDNTIVFFFNDHGQTAKGTLYQGGVLNPSIIWRKGGFSCGPTCDVPISNVDFAPTILEMAGAPHNGDHFDGKSFVGALNGSDAPIHDSLFFEMGYSRAVIQGDFKYLALRYPDMIRNMTIEERQQRLDDFNAQMERRGRPLSTANASTPFSHIQAIPGGGDAERESTSKYQAYYDADQLYNLACDPEEQHNLSNDPECRDKLGRLKEILDGYAAELPSHFGEYGAVHHRSAKRDSHGMD